MKNPAPIKRHHSLVPFSKDHHFGLLLVWKIKQGLSNNVAPVRISNYVLYFFEQDLQVHFLEEERLVFPILAVNDPLRIRAEQEHERMRKLIYEIEQDKNNTELLLRLADELKSHIRFEERTLFNHLQDYVIQKGLTLEFEDDVKGRKDMELAWHDAFWEREERLNS